MLSDQTQEVVKAVPKSFNDIQGVVKQVAASVVMHAPNVFEVSEHLDEILDVADLGDSSQNVRIQCRWS